MQKVIRIVIFAGLVLMFAASFAHVVNLARRGPLTSASCCGVPPPVCDPTSGTPCPK